MSETLLAISLGALLVTSLASTVLRLSIYDQ
jgi:hypothetical protein